MTANYPTYKLPEWTYDKTIGCRIRNRDVIRQFCRSPTTLAANIETFRAIESYKSMIAVLCWKDDDFPDDSGVRLKVEQIQLVICCALAGLEASGLQGRQKLGFFKDGDRKDL